MGGMFMDNPCEPCVTPCARRKTMRREYPVRERVRSFFHKRDTPVRVGHAR